MSQSNFKMDKKVVGLTCTSIGFLLMTCMAIFNQFRIEELRNNNIDYESKCTNIFLLSLTFF